MYSPSINPNIGLSKAIEVSDLMLYPFTLRLMFKGKLMSVGLLPSLFDHMLTNKQMKMEHIELTISQSWKIVGANKGLMASSDSH